MASPAPIPVTRIRYQRIEAWYRLTRANLEGVMRWLEDGHRTGWDGQICIVEECVSAIAKMSHPLPGVNRKGIPATATFSPVAARMIAAKPHANRMLSAMQDRNRAAAVESGKAALAAM